MVDKITIYSEALDLAKAYAGSGSVQSPSLIADFLQAAYDKLLVLAEDVEAN